ncbi:MAG: arylsulfatase [Treponema sp.]|nr:arylsulfatase [Treponema sp.]
MKKTNIVFILVDDMGYGDLGIFGDGSSKTPCLDKLVSEGVCLSHYYTPSPVCAPARAGIITGRYPHRTGAIDTYEAYGVDRMSLKETTLADIFKKNGYRTGLVGKWHLGAFGDEYAPRGRGFEEAVCFRGGWSDYFEFKLDDNGKKRIGKGEYLTEVFTAEAIKYISNHKNEPFFLHVTYNAPHFPFQCPDEYMKQFRETGKFNDTLATLYGMINCMDKGVGEILDCIKKCGIEDDTIVVFASDNGPQLFDKVDRYNCHLHGCKCTAYDGGLRVPAIVKWPGKIPADVRVHDFIHGCDWFPTLLEACGLPVPAELKLDGRSVLGALTRHPDEYGRQRCWQWNRLTPVSKCNAAIRDGKWKLLWPIINEAMQVPADADILDRKMKQVEGYPAELVPYDESFRKIPDPFPAELYNMEDDPLERNNLAGKYPDLVKQLTVDFESWFEEVEAERRSITR